jgi:uncharacterized membrane protein
MNDPIDNPENYIWHTFYFNHNDTRVIVPKRSRILGWTFNFARMQSYLVIMALLSLLFVLSL